MITLAIIIQSALCQIQHHICQGSLASANLTAPRLITVCRWGTKGQWNSTLFVLVSEHLLTKDLYKVSTDVSSFMREYLNPVVEAEHCFQCVDYIGIAANNVTDLTGNFRAAFPCICQARPNMTTGNCHFGIREIEILGKNISIEGASPHSHKVGGPPTTIWEDVQKTPIDVTTTSSDVAYEEQLFFTQTDGEDDTAKQTFAGKEQPQKRRQIGQQMKNDYQ